MGGELGEKRRVGLDETVGTGVAWSAQFIAAGGEAAQVWMFRRLTGFASFWIRY